MSYCTGKNIEKARANALKEYILEEKSISVVARRYGIHRTTMYRWYKKWQELNSVELKNYNHPSVTVGKTFKLSGAKWIIRTVSSAPHSHPKQINQEIINKILLLRDRHHRCAEIIWFELTKEGIKVSLSSIKRILERHHRLNKWSKWKRYHRTIARPPVTCPGDLVEVDTVHYVNRTTGRTRYITTVIDLYSRCSYAKCADRLLPGHALKAVVEAQDKFGFKFKVVQTDNGSEFSRWFASSLTNRGIIHRHTRVHRPNDNAHIERFNRTLRQECIGYHMAEKETSETINTALWQYLDYYNNNRLHLGLECKTPKEMLQR